MRTPLYTLILSFLICTLFSCDESDTPDTTAPSITMESPAEGSRVKGTVKVQITLEDVDEEIDIRVDLDGTSIKQATGKSLSVEIDTKTLTEGAHALKVTATDKAGNSSELVRNFEVRNTLFVLNVSSNYVSEPEYTRIFFTLSKNDGTVMIFDELENGGTITVPTPADFNPDSTFVYSEYFYLETHYPGVTTQFLVRSMNAYVGISAGIFQTPRYTDGRPSVGDHFIKVTDISYPSYTLSFLGQNITPGGYVSYITPGEVNAQIDLADLTSDLIVTFRDVNAPIEAPLYKYFSNIEEGGSTTFSLADSPQMEHGLVSLNSAEGSYSSATQVYFDNADLIFDLYREEGTLSDNKLPLYYPGTTYQEYYFLISLLSNDTRYESFVKGKTPPTSMQYPDWHVLSTSYANNKLKVSTTGSFDMITLQGGTSSIGDGLYTIDSYTVFFPAENAHQVTLPAIPTELIERGFTPTENYQFKTSGFYDFTALSGTADYQHKIVFPSGNRIFGREESMLVIAPLPSATGRKSLPQGMRVPDNLYQLLQRYAVGNSLIERQ